MVAHRCAINGVNGEVNRDDVGIKMNGDNGIEVISRVDDEVNVNVDDVGDGSSNR